MAKKKNFGAGNLFNFHGSFKRKADAVAKEASTPGAFIQKVIRKGKEYWAVMTQRTGNRGKVIGNRKTKKSKAKKSKSKKVKRSKKKNTGITVVTKLANKGKKKTGNREQGTGNRKTKKKSPRLRASVVKKTKRGRRNPANEYESAADQYAAFTGNEGKLTEIAERVAKEECYSGMADLMEIKFRRNGNVHKIEWFDCAKGKVPLLARSTEGHQMFILGGDQNMDAVVKQLGLDMSKRMVDLGEITHITYFGSKPSDPQPRLYEHKMGEEGGERPILVYDTKSHKLHIVGGDYTIDEWIEN